MKTIFEFLKKDKWMTLFIFIFLSFVFMGFILPYLMSLSPYQIYPEFLSIPPAWMQGGMAQFPLGTDDLGRDFFARIAYGARVSMQIGFYVIAMSITIGSALGLMSGYFGGKIDQLIMKFVDMVMSFPSILISILIVTILGPSLTNAIIAVNLTIWPPVIRVVRSVVLKEKEKEYVLAVRSFGANPFRILFFNILPNCLGPIVVQATLGFSEGVLNVAALGFLGLGAEPPIPEWGVMISDGRAFLETSWWLITIPGLFLLLLVMSVNIIGERLRDLIDPRL